MKKALLVLAVAGFLASCDNDGGDAAKKTKDSLDSIENAKKNMIDSNANKAKDAVEQTTDAQKQMVDTMHKNDGKDTTKPKM